MKTRKSLQRSAALIKNALWISTFAGALIVRHTCYAASVEHWICTYGDKTDYWTIADSNMFATYGEYPLHVIINNENVVLANRESRTPETFAVQFYMIDKKKKVASRYDDFIVAMSIVRKWPYKTSDIATGQCAGPDANSK